MSYEVFPDLHNVTRFYQLVQYANNVTGGYLGNIILFLILLVSFLTLLPFGTKKALGSASYISTVFALLLWTLQLVGTFALVVCIVLSAVSTFWLYASED